MKTFSHIFEMEFLSKMNWSKLISAVLHDYSIYFVAVIWGCTKVRFFFIFIVVKITLWGYEPWKWQQYMWEVRLFLELLVVQGSWPLFATAETGGAAASAASVWGKLLFPGAVKTLNIKRRWKFCNLISAKLRRTQAHIVEGRACR